jgi:hypothetical protein
MKTTAILTIIISVLRNAPAVLAALPSALALINKIRAAFGSDKVQEALKALGEFLDKTAPPAPATDSAGSKPACIEEEKRRRWFRFRNRTTVAGTITDNDAWEFCAKHHIQSVENQWT